MTRDICNHLCVFTLFVTFYVSAHMSIFRRYVTIFRPVPLQPRVPSLSHLCLSGDCLHNSDLVDLNAYTTFLRRGPRVAQDNLIKSTERKDSVTNWRQIEFITHEFNKTVRTLSLPRGLNTTSRPTKSVADYEEKQTPVAPTINKALEKNERTHTHLKFYKTLDKFERKFYMVSYEKKYNMTIAENVECSILVRL